MNNEPTQGLGISQALFNKNPKPNKTNIMKTLYSISLMALLVCWGCSQEPSFTDPTTTLPEAVEITGAQFRGGSAATYPSNQMVVQYDPGLTEAQKQLMRDQYGVSDYKTCSCADPTLELWIFEVDPNGNLPGGGGIEEVILGAKDDSGLEGADLNPDIQHVGQKLNYSFGVPDTAVGLQQTVHNNEPLTIAVLDTGVDYNYYGFATPFLYNSQANSNHCNSNGYEDYYGWDFVNGDNDPYDDYGHGTVISSFIYESLIEKSVPFQILPVKVFDANGKGSYFDILCGFKYAINNSDVDMINLSFGWYLTDYELLHRFVMESESQVLITASAGNNAQDNDQVPHYPSSYTTSNIISVAALGGGPSTVQLAYFSNYGENSVDIAAQGENIPFYLAPNEPIYVSGTSYANAFATVLGGTVYVSGMTPQQHLGEVLSHTVPNSNLYLIQYESYVPY